MKNYNKGDVMFKVFLTIVSVCTLILIVFLSFHWADSLFLTSQQSFGEVVNKKFVPEHVTNILIYNSALKTSLAQPVYHDDKWSLKVKVRGKISSISVSEDLFNSVSKSSIVEVKYTIGRFSKNIYLISIYR